MQNSRLIEVLYALSPKKIRELGKMVHSPFFNQRPQVVHLFDYLAACKLDWKVEPEKEKAFKKIFPGVAYEDSKLRKTMSLLMKLLEQYLVFRQVSENEIQTQIHLASAYRQMNLPKHFSQVLRGLQKKQAERQIQNADFFNDNYQIQLEEYEFTANSQRIGELNLQEISDNLDIFYLAQKLRQTCFSLAHQAVYKKEYHLGLLADLLEKMKHGSYLDVPAISLYYYCYLALTEEEGDTYFSKFKSLIFQHSQKFPLSEIRSLYLLALNFCIKQFNAGKKDFAQEAFDLYKEGLLHDFLLEEGKLSRFTYNNIVAIGLTIGALDWVEDFIFKYKVTLEKAYRESNFSFNLSRLLYEKKEYDQCLHLLQKSEYKDLLLNLSAKTVMLKIYYELEEFDLLYAHIDALQTFIRRKKVIGYHRELYLNVIHFTKRMLELLPGDRAAKKELKKAIIETKAVAEKRWLLNIIEEA